MKFSVDPDRLNFVISRLSKIDRTGAQGLGNAIEIRASPGWVTFIAFNEAVEVCGHLAIDSESEPDEVRYVDAKSFEKMVGGLYAGSPAQFTIALTDVRATQGSIKLKIPSLVDKTGRFRFAVPPVEHEFVLGNKFFDALDFVAIAAPKRAVGHGKYAGAVLDRNGLVSESSLVSVRVDMPMPYDKSLGIPVGLIPFLQSVCSKTDSPSLAIQVGTAALENAAIKSYGMQISDPDSPDVAWGVSVVLRHPVVPPASEMGPVSTFTVDRQALEQALATVSSVLGDGEVAIVFKAISRDEQGNSIIGLSGVDQIGMSDAEIWVPLVETSGEFRTFRVVKESITTLVKYNAADSLTVLIPEDVRGGIHIRMQKEGANYQARVATVY